VSWTGILRELFTVSDSKASYNQYTMQWGKGQDFELLMPGDKIFV
jgi:hypothetical protein